MNWNLNTDADGTLLGVVPTDRRLRGGEGCAVLALTDVAALFYYFALSALVLV